MMRNLLKSQYLLLFLAILTLFSASGQLLPDNKSTDVDDIKRTLVAVQDGDNGVYISWPLLGSDPEDVGFNVYRAVDGGSAELLNDIPIVSSTNYYDSTAVNTSANSYFVVAVINDVEQEPSESVEPWDQQYLAINLQVPPGGTNASGDYSYTANDASVADVDGDGDYEIILKWYPTNAKDNSQSGYTGNTYLDAYELDGTQLWRIDLGINCRAGAHYNPFMVYDFDGDGRAELACRTAPGTRDGLGNFLNNGPASSDDDSADFRNSSGYILTGPEYLTMFQGTDGAELTTIDLEPDRGSASDWGDSYGNRVDRLTAAVAYLDGEQPSLLWCRGIYTKVEIAAYDWDGTDFTQRWIFKSQEGYEGWSGMGSHNLSVGDVDQDGNDELVYGNCAIDHDGTGLWTLKPALGTATGDAMHLADIMPDRPGLEKWGCMEGDGTSGSNLVDAATGEVIWETPAGDVGRATAGDLSPDYYGMEVWGGTDGLRSAHNARAGNFPSSINHVVWWDGDLSRELLDGITITKYQEGGILTADGCASNNGSKSNPTLQADIFGDWREEVIWRTTDNTQLRIYTTTIPTEYRIKTLMHDRQYRLAIAWQNNSYNQPPHPGFYLGNDMFTPAEEIPPSNPTGFRLQLSNDQVQLVWEPNFQTDVIGYNVFKSTAGGEFELLDGAPFDTVSVVDTMVVQDIQYRYYVTAIDADGNESGPSATEVALITYRPDAPSPVYSRYGPDETLLFWEGVSGDSTSSGSNGGGPTGPAEQDGLTIMHSYRFADGTASDEVGEADGTIIGGIVEGGSYVTSVNGDYIELPASDIAINTYDAVTLETYIRAGDGANTGFTMLSFFGNTVGDFGVDYFSTSVARGDDVSRAAISIGNTTEPWTVETGANGSELDDGELHHVVSVISDSKIYLYIDGFAADSVELTGSNALSAVSTELAYLANGGYTADPTWIGSIAEFNIYEGVMSSETVLERASIFPVDDFGNDSDSIVGYNVYVSEQEAFVKLNDEPLEEMMYHHTGLQSGETYEYQVTTIDGAFRESFPSETISITTGPEVVVQAENGEYENVVFESNHEGFNGTGFANFGSEGYLELRYVYGMDEGYYELITRHALGTESRTGEVTVNDNTVEFTMEGTGEWTNFVEDTLIVQLTPGFTNTIRFVATGNDFGNLDQIRIGDAVEVDETVLDITTEKPVIYPNPVQNGRLSIYIPEELNAPDYQLLSIGGKVVGQGRLKQGFNGIQVRHLNKGLYVIQLSHQGILSSSHKILID